MICELTNKTIDVLEYTFEGEMDPCAHKDSYSVMCVIMCYMMFVMTMLFLAWWVIPLRKLGFFDIKFTCDKKE